MIEKMKKATIIMVDSGINSSLDSLRELGVLHISRKQTDSEQYIRFQQERDKAEKTVFILEDLLPKKKKNRKVSSAKNIDSVIESVLNFDDEANQLSEERKQLLMMSEQWSAFGNIRLDDLLLLRKKGFGFHFYQTNLDDLELIEEEYDFLVLKKKGRDVFIALVGREWPGQNELILPEKDLESIDLRLKVIEARLAEISCFLEDQTRYLDSLKEKLGEIDYHSEYESVKNGAGLHENLVSFEGYIPLVSVENLKESASLNGWGLALEDPAEDAEDVPTKLKMDKFSGILKPILDILGILPGYREYDVSFFFLIFFSIFTAMLIGDAGYGFLFLGVTIIGSLLSLIKTKKVPTIFALLFILSVSTIIWGAVTGTWFASKFLMGFTHLSQFRIAFFSGSENEVNQSVMFIAFFLGVVQLSLACIQGFIREFPSLKSFARLGWLATIISIYFFILNQVLGMTFPKPMLYVLIGGVAFIMVFGQQEKGQNFFIGVLKGTFANLLQNFLDVVGSFANIMSYIRLFAVGLASVKIAETFNSMASGMTDGAAIIGAVVILLLGHGLNIILGLLAVFVHAVRLNILEYSGQIGMEWSGFPYKPFKTYLEDKEKRGE